MEIVPCLMTVNSQQLEINNDSIVEIGIAGLNFRASHDAERKIDT